jgi:UDP-N-acetylglucosamine--N-acetylmuramyl-(pentapeptide) pyrophosphoryl-undecaprenol N-acetylglucosamine transferase
MRTLFALPLAVVNAGALLEQIRPAAVLSLGGYAAGPVVLAAIARDIPVTILETNALPGLAHRLAGPFSTRALLGFEQAGRYFPAGRWEVSGIPVRKEFFDLPRKVRGERFHVLITGGSQGSQRLNQAAVNALPILAARGLLGALKFTHQTGAKEYNGVRSTYALQQAEADVTPFIDDMPRAFRDADLVICRAGASAVGELAAAGKASILIPFPFAADQHQLRNAEAMQAAGAAQLVLDADWTGARFAAEMERLAGSPRLLESMEDAALQLARPAAAQRVAERLLEIAERRSAASKVH